MDDKVYMIAHQAESQYYHQISDSTYWHAVHAVDIVPVAFENHILFQPVRTCKYANDFPYNKAKQTFSSVKRLILSFFTQVVKRMKINYLKKNMNLVGELLFENNIICWINNVYL